MRTTIDRAGRLVIPKALRESVGLPDGGLVDVSVREGRLEIDPVAPEMRLVDHEGFTAAVIEGFDGPALTVEQVRAVLEHTRR